MLLFHGDGPGALVGQRIEALHQLLRQVVLLLVEGLAQLLQLEHGVEFHGRLVGGVEDVVEDLREATVVKELLHLLRHFEHGHLLFLGLLGFGVQLLTAGAVVLVTRHILRVTQPLRMLTEYSLLALLGMRLSPVEEQLVQRVAERLTVVLPHGLLEVEQLAQQTFLFGRQLPQC